MFKIVEGLALLDSEKVVRLVTAGRSIKVGDFNLEPDEVHLKEVDRQGLSVVMEGDYAVAVSVQISEDLIKEGIAREMVHRIQNMRRSAGFDVADHIITYVEIDAAFIEVVNVFESYIKQETLSRSIIKGGSPANAFVETHNLNGKEVAIGVIKDLGLLVHNDKN